MFPAGELSRQEEPELRWVHNLHRSLQDDSAFTGKRTHPGERPRDHASSALQEESERPREVLVEDFAALEKEVIMLFISRPAASLLAALCCSETSTGRDFHPWL